jgi:hypothetical protein
MHIINVSRMILLIGKSCLRDIVEHFFFSFLVSEKRRLKNGDIGIAILMHLQKQARKCTDNFNIETLINFLFNQWH